MNSDPDLTRLLYEEGLDDLARAKMAWILHNILHPRDYQLESSLDWVEAGQVPNGFGSVPLRLVGRKQYPTRGAFEAYDRIACATRSHTHEKLLRRSDFGQAIEDLLGTGKGSLTVMEIRNELRNTAYPNLQNIDVITAVLKPKH